MIVNLRQRLQESLGVSESQLNRLFARSPHTYKVYSIPKKSGGDRVVAQPAKETKFIQSWLIDHVLKDLPVHDCASAYKLGASIKKNASAHKDNMYFAKYDFKDFFSSIRAADLVIHITKYLGETFNTQDIQDIVRISCIKHKDRNYLCLSVGAPSSPLLSNTIMYDFDAEVALWCEKSHVTYTRYADDLTFSSNIKGISSEIEKMLVTTIKKLGLSTIHLNHKKTTHLSKKHQRRITGIVINNEGNISLGRDRKREISALIHKFSLELLPEDEIFRLQGLLGFAKDVEPLFLFSMRVKYKSTLINEILQLRK